MRTPEEASNKRWRRLYCPHAQSSATVEGRCFPQRATVCYHLPTWLLDKNILNKFSNPTTESISDLQDNRPGYSLLSAQRLERLIISGNRTTDPYTIDELF